MGKGGSGKSSGGYGKAAKGASKGKVRNDTVLKRKVSPWKDTSSNGNSGKGKGGKSGGGGRWVWVEEQPPARQVKTSPSKGKGKTKGKAERSGKGKGKGKGKMRKAAPLASDFWQKKVESEGRKELGDTAYAGVIVRYSVKQGWGLIRPDSLQGLPGQAKKKIQEAESAQEAEGKEVKESGLLYFRKPDVNHAEGFKLAAETSVTFRVYVDEKGAGAMDVSMV
mmetsp:Transcript_48524/g.90931  ORF Transcript_48524/g.90931 Transcript_48524/m.90931 type:complete len:223 (+) Transcript_48524:62-730(+)